MTKKKAPKTPLAAALDKGLDKPKNPRIQAAAIKASKAKAAKAAAKTKEVMTRMKRKLHIDLPVADGPGTTLVRFATDRLFTDTFDTDTTMRIELSARAMQSAFEQDNRLIGDLRYQLGKSIEQEQQAVTAVSRGVLHAVESDKRIKALEEELASTKAGAELLRKERSTSMEPDTGGAIAYHEVFDNETFQHRICYGVPGETPLKRGRAVVYSAIAQLEYNGVSYRAVTQYHEGDFPIEQVFTIKALRSSEAVVHHDDSAPESDDEEPPRIGGAYAEVADEIVDGPDPDADPLEDKDHAALACSAPPDHLPDYSHDAAEFEALVADPAVP